jgi:hypothetical protein
VRATRHCAEQAADQLFRGVVSASSAVEAPDQEPEATINGEQGDDDPQG